MDEIRIYVADLAAYNNGKLHGVWVDACGEMDEIWNAVNKMLKTSPEEMAEEYAIHDYEGFGSVRLSEYEGLESAREKALFIEEHGELGAQVLSHWCEDLEDARKALEDSYAGVYESLADYAQQLSEDTSEVPAHLEYYIDYEKMGRDMEMSGDIYTIETAHDEVHIFWNH
tara:strand:- start:22965 stop:23477 length:513 start_codon:yes stop_codon:yes gene_type:complete